MKTNESLEMTVAMGAIIASFLEIPSADKQDELYDAPKPKA